MSIRRIAPIAVAALVLVVVGFRLFGGGNTASLISLDGQSGSSSQAQGARNQGSGQQGNKPQPSPTTGAPNVDGLDQASIQKDAFILLNPASATAGSNIGVSGSGFDPASVIDFYLTADPKNDKKPQELGFAQADSGGSFGNFGFGLPPNYRNASFTVIARERNSNKEAQATGRLESLRPSVKMGTGVGSVGDNVQISAQGFMPGEEVKVYFNSLSGDAFQSFKSSDGGTIEKQAVKIPYGPVGNNSLIFVGSQSQAPVTVQFLMLTLYPNVAMSSYAAKADTVLSFSGTGFGPDEDVDVHLNNPQAPPIVKFHTGGDGTFENSGAFVIPFELNGKNTLIFVGEKSQATATAGFDVLPYTPNVQPSTYGGRPGTSITFYGDGFARDEVVRFYVDRSRDSAGTEVACAKADDQGRIGAGGSYTIPPMAQTGQQQFAAIGSRSNAVTSTTVEIMDAGVPLQAPALDQPAFHCPYDDQENGAQPQATPQVVPAPAIPQSGQAQGNRSQATPGPLPTARPQSTPAVTPTSVGSAQGSQGGRSAVISDSGGPVGMRSDPMNPNSVKATLNPGTTVELVGDTRTVGNDQWIRVKANGQDGWIPANSVQLVTQPRSTPPAGR